MRPGLVLTLLASGCSSSLAQQALSELDGADLGDEAVTAFMLREAGADGVVAFAERQVFGLANQAWTDVACPVATTDEDTTTFAGDCETTLGTHFSGSLQLRTVWHDRTGELTDLEVVAEQFSMSWDGLCQASADRGSAARASHSVLLDGTYRRVGREFAVDLLYDTTVDSDEPACAAGRGLWAARMEGQIVVHAEDGPVPERRVLQAEGALGITPYGRVDAITRDLTFTACPAGPVTGTVTLTSSRGNAEHTYDNCGGAGWLNES